MTGPKPVSLEVQIARAGRRLLVQALVNRLAVCWAGSLAAGLAWFLVQPFVVAAPEPWLGWAVAGAFFLLGTGLGVLLAWHGAPSNATAALFLDERFGLKERVTTSLMLTPQERATPAGQALLKDARQRVAALDVASRFPLRLSWVTSLVPLAAAVLILVALFYQPSVSPANARPNARLQQPPANAVEIARAMDKLRPKVKDPALANKEKSDKLKEIEAEMERIANRPHETRADARERMKEVEALEDKIRDFKKELAADAKAVKDQLKEMNRQAGKAPDGPAGELQKALAEGDPKRAKEELEQLADKLDDKKLDEQQKKDLDKQLDDLKAKAEQAAKAGDEKKPKEQRDREARLEKLIEEAKKEGRDAEALERELTELRMNDKGLVELKELAQKLGECKQCMKQGDDKAAAEKLKEAAAQMKKMGQSDQELQALQDKMQRLDQAKGALAKDSKDGQGEGDKPGQAQASGSGKQGEGDKGAGDKGEGGKGNGDPGDGMGQGDKGVGKRPFGKDKGDTTPVDARQKAGFDPSKTLLPAGFAPGQNFKAKSEAEVAAEIKHASQAAPEAIEQQRIPRAKRDIAKDYYKNLGEQAEKK